MKTVKDLEGELVLALIPRFNAEIPRNVRLHKVEEYGIWIESQTQLEALMNVIGTLSMPATPIFFIPWSHVEYLIELIDSPSFSDKLVE